MLKNILIFFILAPGLLCAQIQYPLTKTSDQKDDYFGKYVADPYRWLEDDKSPDTKAWIEAENKVTSAWLDSIPFRDRLKEKLEKLYDYTRYGVPFHHGSTYYFFKNDGLQNQSILYRQEGLNGTPEIVIDPNLLSSDGTSRILHFQLSGDGAHAAYTVSKAGSDWEDIYVMDMHTLKYMNDHLDWVKLSNIAWQGDGFYYSRYPAPEPGTELMAKNENHQVYYHTIGTGQDQDKLVFEDKEHPLRFNEAWTSEDEKYIFMSVRDKGDGKGGNALFYKTKEDKTFKEIDGHFNNANVYICARGEDVFILAGKGTKNLNVVRYNIETDNMTSIIAESDPIETVRSAGGRLFVTYLTDARQTVKVFDLDGHLQNEIKLQDLGTISFSNGRSDDKEVFYSFITFTCPATIFSYSIAENASKVFRKPSLKFNPDDFQTEQVFYTSKDGTKVPMYVVSRKDMKKTGSNPTLLYGYGGFGTCVTPSFNSHLIPFLEEGGIYASANIRGGGEYGDSWHKAGSKRNKQNSIDDFIYAAKYLIKKKYTDSGHLAVRGVSNGGLLIGAVCNQQPALFRVAIAQAGVMDMLRFQKFTIGWNWKAEYGTSEDEKDFEVLYSYSPLHNVKPNVAYPAILVTTADHDDRVVPAHSYKYVAALQAASGRSMSAPLLLRIETNSGHGASSMQKTIESMADIYSFIFYNMGITPKLETMQ